MDTFLVYVDVDMTFFCNFTAKLQVFIRAKRQTVTKNRIWIIIK